MFILLLDMIAMIGKSDRPCWMTEAYIILFLLLVTCILSKARLHCRRSIWITAHIESSKEPDLYRKD